MLTKKKNISYGALAVAFVFLFNPNITIIDFLPDFIGYIILSIALSKIALLSETLYDAKRAFERLIILDVGKIFSILWVYGMDSGGSEHSTSLLLWSFIFGVLECIFAIPAYIKLFDGFSSLGNFHSNTSIHGKKSRNKKESYTDSVRRFSVFFIILKAVFTCIPEITALGMSSYDDNSRFFDFYDYIGVIRGLFFVPVLIVGTVWLALVIKYFVRISKDRAFTDAINEEYSQKKSTKKGAFIIKDVKIATAFMVIASIFSIDFNLDGINVLPDFFVVVALALSLFYFSKTAKIKKGFAIVAFSLFFIATLLEDYVRYYFADNFYYNAINKNGEAFACYIVTVIAVAVEGIILALVYASAARAIKSVVLDHTGYVLGKSIESEGEKKQILVVQKRLNKNFSVLVDFAIVCALADTFGSLYGAFYAFLNKNFGWMGLLSMVCGLLLVGMTVKAVSELREAVQTKYMLE